MSELDTTELMAAAREAALASYSPYSKFRVGAVVVTDAGDRFSGCNVENGAYGASICAEANAIASAIAAGARKIEAIAVACLDGAECYPCGNCRQLMSEFGVQLVIVQDGSGGVHSHELSELLPHSFDLEPPPT